MGALKLAVVVVARRLVVRIGRRDVVRMMGCGWINLLWVGMYNSRKELKWGEVYKEGRG